MGPLTSIAEPKSIILQLGFWGSFNAFEVITTLGDLKSLCAIGGCKAK